MTADALKKMQAGESPSTPEEWKELAEFLGAASQFMQMVNSEVDEIETVLEIMQSLWDVAVKHAPSDVQQELRKVVLDGYKSKGFHVSEVQTEDNGSGKAGPGEQDDGGTLSPEGEPM